jgi:sphinganine C4-monooxygenase
MLGTSWTGGDISIRYERSRLAAQKKMDEDQKSANASDPVLSENLLHPEKNFKNISGGVDELELIPVEEQQRGIPVEEQQRGIPVEEQQRSSLTQEETQMTESRQQVLDDTEGGGFDVLLDESREERDAQLLIRDRRRQANHIYGTESLKGLRDRVSGIMHGRASGIIGMESNHEG